jgi:hypothetical protein
MRAFAALSLSLFLTGCAFGPTASPTPGHGTSISGNVHGGRQPIVGAHVYLFAANTTGYGQPSVSLLNSSSTGLSDSLGAYVLSDSNGAFTITGDYTCTPGQQAYIYTLGGDPGAGTNSAASLMALLGSCPASGGFASTTPFVSIDEVTTIAAAYAMSGFATDATHVSSSGTTQAQTGVANAFANATNLASISTGAALATTPAGNGTVPQTEINTLANILASCVNSSGAASTACSTLFSNATSGSATPTDTATAAINIAHNPGSNVATLFGLQVAAAPFQPTLGSAPNDWTVSIFFSGSLRNPNGLAIDGQGNVWILTGGSGIYASGLNEANSLGALLSPVPLGYTGGGLDLGDRLRIAIDSTNDVWISSLTGSTFYGTASGVLSKFDSSGTAISGSSGFTGGGLNNPEGLAIDGNGNVWTVNFGNTSISEFNSSGSALSPSSGYTGGGLQESGGLDLSNTIALDSSGNVWVANFGSSNSISEFNSSGSPISGPTGFTGGGLASPVALAVDASGNVWTAKLR